MKEIRENILEHSFEAYYKLKREELILADEENPSSHPKRIRPPRSERGMKLGDYEVHVSEKGFSSIKQISSGEIMHSVNSPEEEARTLYIEPSHLRERLTQGRPLRVWDVGLGAATNAMALIHELESILSLEDLTPVPRTEIVSFEIDLDPLHLALKHPQRFLHLRHAAPHELLKEGEWKNTAGTLRWILATGNFLERMSEFSPPDLIYYDPFSFKTDSALWTQNAFRKIYRHCCKHQTTLMTYSASTLVRALLLSEGFFVGAGAPTGPKTETTIAFTRDENAILSGKLLGLDWLAKWQKSGAKYPENISDAERAQFESKILDHPQFHLK